MFIKNPKAKLQGDRIETPDFIRKNSNIRVDFIHYVRNILSKPLSQLLALKLREIPTFNYKNWMVIISNENSSTRCARSNKANTYISDLTKRIDKIKNKIQKISLKISSDIKPSDVSHMDKNGDRKTFQREMINYRSRTRNRMKKKCILELEIKDLSLQLLSKRKTIIETCLWKNENSINIDSKRLRILKERYVHDLLFEPIIKQAQMYNTRNNSIFNFMNKC